MALHSFELLHFFRDDQWYVKLETLNWNHMKFQIHPTRFTLLDKDRAEKLFEQAIGLVDKIEYPHAKFRMLILRDKSRMLIQIAKADPAWVIKVRRKAYLIRPFLSLIR